ncbi:MAG: DNA gyrase subunit A, partial [Lachnospiraceae bacterium]|nr:DNA gyrase subunit A [Lachnospiraceae bacterium]
ILQHYLRHQEDVVTRRTKFDLRKAEERAHIIEGLFIALDHIDEVIRIIRAAANVQEAKLGLMNRFGLSDAQSQAIVDMRLRALTGLERSKLEEEYADLEQKISNWKAILADENLLLGVIRDELQAVSDKFGDERKTRIENDEDEILDEDLIPVEDTVIAMTKLGYIKRMSLDQFKAQNRGGRGIKGMQVIDEDYTTELQMTETHDNILFFTNQGRVYMMKVYEVPEASRTSRGTPIINLIPLQAGERVTAVVTQKELDTDRYILMATKDGTIKKTPAEEYRNVRKNGLLAITLKEGDELIRVKDTAGDEEVLLVSKKGNTIRFSEQDIRISGRTSIGVRGIRVDEDDELVSMEVHDPEKTILFVSENGLGKRSVFSEFSVQGRGGKGARGYKVTDKSGYIVGTESVSENEEVLIITTEGIVIRTKVESIPVLGRTTSGVKLINLDKESDAKVASFTIVTPDEEDESEEPSDDTNG